MSPCIGQNVNAGGCKPPDYQIYVCSFDSMRSIIYNLVVIQHGACSLGFEPNKWLLIPKIPDSCSVTFQAHYETLDE
jgi:hypothetical protein